MAEPFAVDYLSWSDRETRQFALRRSTTPDSEVDGWGGTGRQWADSPSTLGISRNNRLDNGGEVAEGTPSADVDRAVVTVRVRVTPFTAEDTAASPPPGSSPESEQPPSHIPTAEAPRSAPNAASGPTLDEPGWVAEQPRWVNLAVPVGRAGGRVVVTAMPALVGSPQTSAPEPAVPRDSTLEDGEFARNTRETVTTLLRAYATGDLQYARAAGTSFRGLDNAVELTDVDVWRTRVGKSADETGRSEERVRVGDVTVTWALSGDAGALRCTYRVELRHDGTPGTKDGGAGGRWYLASVEVPAEAVT